MNAKVNLAKTSGATSPSGMSMTGSNEFVVFQLGDREYAVNVRQVQGLRGYRSLTRIANGPDFVEGVAISDGVIMPIIDMRLHFNIAAPTFDHFTVVILIHVRGRAVGLVVDSASDVISLAEREVRPVSGPGSQAPAGSDYLSGIASYHGRDLILMDLQKLMQDTSVKENEKMKA